MELTDQPQPKFITDSTETYTVSQISLNDFLLITDISVPSAG